MSGTYLIDGQEAPVTAEVQAALTVEAGPPPVPASITNYQARAVLDTLPGSAPGRSLFDDIDEAMRAGKDTPEGKMSWQAWEQANEFTRDGTLVNQLAPTFGLTSEALDELFRQAATISA